MALFSACDMFKFPEFLSGYTPLFTSNPSSRVYLVFFVIAYCQPKLTYNLVMKMDEIRKLVQISLKTIDLTVVYI